MDALQSFLTAHPSVWILTLALITIIVLRIFVRLACLGITVILGIAVVLVALDMLR